MANDWMNNGAVLALGAVGLVAAAGLLSRELVGSMAELGGSSYVPMEIWGRYRGGEWELIDTSDEHNPVDVMLSEYQMAYGPDWEWKTRRVRGSRSSDDPWITRPGKLGGPGYLSRSAAERHKILDRCVAQYGYRSCLGSIQVLMRNRKVYARHRAALDTDNDYLVSTYGGPGSFGPRQTRQQRRLVA